MWFKEKKIKVRKYRKLSLKTYDPIKRNEMNKEGAVTLFLRLTSWFLLLGGVISFFISSLLIGIRGFFGIREKSREVFRGKTIAFRVKKYK